MVFLFHLGCVLVALFVVKAFAVYVFGLLLVYLLGFAFALKWAFYSSEGFFAMFVAIPGFLVVAGRYMLPMYVWW